MEIKKLMVVVGSAASSGPAIDAALTVARKFTAHVEALHVRADPRQAIPYMGEGMSGAMVDDILRVAEKEAVDRSAKGRALFDEKCRAAGVEMIEGAPSPGKVSARWYEVTGREEELVARHGRVSDLIVAARQTEAAEMPSTAVLEAALLETGRALLLAPPTPPVEVGSVAAVAWLGSVEAARAVGAALPFLSRAKEVHIIAWGEQEAASSTQDLQDYLALHDIESRVTKMEDMGSDVGEPLMAECKGVGADLLVMGGYTRSRLRQMILGGTTSHILHHAEIPVLMAH
ncbi:MAG: universal stress protein [Alphaproteobacteria bacterium]